MSVAEERASRNVAAEPPLDEDHAPKLKKKVGRWIGAHPAIVIGAGLAIGAAIGWYVKRKK